MFELSKFALLYSWYIQLPEGPATDMRRISLQLFPLPAKQTSAISEKFRKLRHDHVSSRICQPCKSIRDKREVSVTTTFFLLSITDHCQSPISIRTSSYWKSKGLCPPYSLQRTLRHRKARAESAKRNHVDIEVATRTNGSAR